MAKTPDVVAKEILAKLAITAPGFSLEVGTPERKIVDAVAESISESYVDQYLVGSLLDIESKAGIELEQFVGIFGFGRLQGKKASGTVRVELKTANGQDITVPLSSQFYTRQSLPSSGKPLYFNSTQSVVIPAGSYVVDVPVECADSGTAGNVPPDSIVYIGEILGASSVTNLQSFIGGADPETDNELRQRFKDTFLRSIVGTEDWYLGLCYKNDNVKKAACFGPVKKYSTQVVIEDDLSVNLSAAVTDDVKFAWDGDWHIAVYTNLGQADEQFYRRNLDYEWVAGATPQMRALAGGALAAGDVVDVEFEYTTRSSRNDPQRGITNKVDVFVNGSDPYVVTERTRVPAAVPGSQLSTDPDDPLYVGNFVRVGLADFRADSSRLVSSRTSLAEVSGTGPYTVALTNIPTGGTFTLSYGNKTTPALPYNAEISLVQSALNNLSTIGPGNATVEATLDGDENVVPWSYTVTLLVDTHTLTAASALINVAAAPTVQVDGNIVAILNSPTSGVYTLTYGAKTTTTLAYNASTATVQAALEALDNIGSGKVTVTGTATAYTITLADSTKLPLADNRFTRLGSTPVVSFPSLITVSTTDIAGGTGAEIKTIYKQGEDYHLIKPAPLANPNVTTLLAGSPYEIAGLEWLKPDSPADDTAITLSYSYNRVPEILQAVIKTGKQLSTDVLVHQAEYQYLRVYLSVEYDRGFVVTQVNNAIQERLRNYFAGMPYGSWIEFSDLTLAVHQVLGVDNVRVTDPALDPGVGVHYGVKIYTDSANTVPASTQSQDFKLKDNQLPVFLDAVMLRKANR